MNVIWQSSQLFPFLLNLVAIFTSTIRGEKNSPCNNTLLRVMWRILGGSDLEWDLLTVFLISFVSVLKMKTVRLDLWPWINVAAWILRCSMGEGAVVNVMMSAFGLKFNTALQCEAVTCQKNEHIFYGPAYKLTSCVRVWLSRRNHEPVFDFNGWGWGHRIPWTIIFAAG